MNWKPGDRAAIIVSYGIDAGKLSGTFCKLIMHIGKVINAELMNGGPPRGILNAWLVDVDGIGPRYISERSLHPIPDDKASWEQVEKITGWRPQEIAV